MAVTYATFTAEFPTFDQVDETIIDAKIADAELQIDVGAYGVLYDTAVKYLTAHLLTIAPYGMQIGPQDEPARSTFGDHYEKLKLLSHRRGQITGGGLT
jgi:hypothetical protein